MNILSNRSSVIIPQDKRDLMNKRMQMAKGATVFIKGGKHGSIPVDLTQDEKDQIELD